MLEEARGNNLTLRARLAEAHHVRLGRLAAGLDDEQSEDAEAGAILAVERDHDLHVLVLSLPDIIRALGASTGA